MSTVARSTGGPPGIPSLLRRLVDDAALFPPGSASMDVAVAEHRHHRSAPYADLVGPLLVPSGRVDELRSLLGSGPALEVGLIGDGTGLSGLRAAVEVVLADPRLRLRQVEHPADTASAPAVLEVARVLAEIPDTERYVEIPRGTAWLDAVRALAGQPWNQPVGAKLRTGGLRADAFPTDDELAAFLTTCLDAGLPFKLTAGLHHAVRHTAAETGFEHHGYLNVLAVVGDTRRPDVPDVVAERRGGPLAERVRTLLGGADTSRRCFRSYGSCSVAEPLTDLADLGLLDRQLLEHLPAPREGHA
ncbi:MAG: hypothetical protein WCA46_09820 [Actinocatenispora sp.]